MNGTLALVGGKPFAPGCTFNGALVEAAGATEVVLLPTAAAFEGPEKIVAAATAYFSDLGVGVRCVNVLSRADAAEPANAAACADAKLIYLVGSAAMHARPTLQDTPVWDAVVEAWNRGATVVGSDAGAQVLCDPMVDDRGGAFTVGLGLIRRIAALTRLNTWSDDALHRLRQMTNPDVAVIGIDEGTAVVRAPGGDWRVEGTGNVSVHIGSAPVELSALDR